jgi:predicted transposase YdaD
MTLEESKQLEEKIANDILNNIQFSHVYQLVTEEAKTRARGFVSGATEEQLLEVKKKMEETEAAAAAAEAEAKAQAEKSAKID